MASTHRMTVRKPKPALNWMAAGLLGLGGVLGLALGLAGAMNRQMAPYLKGATPKLARSGFQKNPHTHQKITLTEGQYRFSYVFKDHKGRDWQWNWGWEQQPTDQLVAGFGVPDWMFKPYIVNAENLRARDEAMQKGMFSQSGNLLLPDFDRLTARSLPFTRPLYEMARQAAHGSRDEMIRMLLAFAQDVPYAIPPDTSGGKVLAGVLAPPQTLLEGWGDCDTKAVLLASVLAHDPEIGMVFLTLPNHMLMGIEGQPRPYQKYIEYQGKTYLLAEPAGPGQLGLGTPFEPYPAFQGIKVLRAGEEILEGEDPVADNLTQAARFAGEGAVQLTDEVFSPGLLKLTLRTNGQPLLARLEFRGQEIPGRTMAQTVTDGSTVLLARMDQPGDYLVRVFARGKGDKGGVYNQVLAYPFSAEGPFSPASPFPEFYTRFLEIGGMVEAPLEGVLHQGEKVSFKLRLPGMETGWVSINGRLTPLERQGEWFVGNFTAQGREISVFAGKPGSRRFEGMARYEVK
ncbi:MAG: hypothetical protein OEW12_02500 [Deltaproteobacteria bacterium]|nr:hypothetical protein [Deltaproteobacteria bacterium]